MWNNDYILRSDALKAILGVSIYDTIEELEGARTIAENTWADGLYDAYKIIEEEVDAADAEPKQRWISVNSDKPKEDGKYFVLRHSQGRPIVEIMYYGIPEYLKDRHFYFYDSEWGDVVVGDVTHWLPLSALPEPPKGGRRW